MHLWSIRNMKLLQAVLIIGIVCGLAASPARAGAGGGSRAYFHPGANTHLVIKRAANFGNESHFNIYIDGAWVANLGYGRSYHGIVPAGSHLVTIKQMPHLNDANPFS